MSVKQIVKKLTSNGADVYDQLPELIDAWTVHGLEIKLGKFVGELYKCGAHIFLVDQDYLIHYCTVEEDGNVFYYYQVDAKLVGDHLILVNADDDGGDLTPNETEGFIGVSFSCLSRLGLNYQNIKLIDYSNEDYGEIHVLSEKQLKEWQKVNNDPAKFPHKSPGLGYTLLHYGNYWENDKYRWHKAGHVLVEFKNKSYLLGFDDGQYFGVELPKKVNSVKDALKSLTPVGAGNSSRQGEWFVVCTSEPKEAVTLVDITEAALPYEEGGNPHKICARKIVVKNDIVYAFDGLLKHDQHDSVNFNGWVKFLKNTAVRSVSVEGVD